MLRICGTVSSEHVSETPRERVQAFPDAGITARYGASLRSLFARAAACAARSYPFSARCAREKCLPSIRCVLYVAVLAVHAARCSNVSASHAWSKHSVITPPCTVEMSTTYVQPISSMQRLLPNLKYLFICGSA
jgi:hypothetical protein